MKMNLVNPIIATLSAGVLLAITLSACTQSPSETGQIPEPDSVFVGLRQQVLSVTPETIGWSESSGPVLGILIETGLAKGVVTLVALGDGTTSLYLSNGGAWIGMGGIESVGDASSNMLELAGSFVEAMETTDIVPLPGVARVRFTVFTLEGLKSQEVAEEALQTQRDKLWPLYQAGHEVLAAIRQIQEQREE